MPLVPPYIESLVPYQGRTQHRRNQGGLRPARRHQGLPPMKTRAGPSRWPLRAIPAAPGRSAPVSQRRPGICAACSPRGTISRWRTSIAGSGSERDHLEHHPHFLCDDDEVLTNRGRISIGFPGAGAVARRQVPDGPLSRWHYDLPALEGQINDRTKIVYLANTQQSDRHYFFSRQGVRRFLSPCSRKRVVVHSG